MTTSCLHYFSEIGFLKEKPIALKLLKNVSEILSADNVAYCLMFGTLLGKLRHDDFIPWDDDIDIIIFDVEKTALVRNNSAEYNTLDEFFYDFMNAPIIL